MINLFITEDHELYLKGLTLLLSGQPGIMVCDTAGSGIETIEKLSLKLPDVLLLDINLPDTDAEDLLKKIRAQYPSLKIIYHTMLRGTRYLHKLMQQGIQGYILKSASSDELLEAITKVASGGEWFSKEIDITIGGEEAYKKTVIVPDSKIHAILSKREMEILKMICKEYSSADIAARLFLSVSTVDTHRKNITEKLGVNNTVGLVKFALKYGLIND
ncbi:MAG TPA: response regulator transcription factor [Chitinophagaceae bacterium]|nr:response regulator transcription factor [Chitinophagaceae bacterium]